MWFAGHLLSLRIGPAQPRQCCEAEKQKDTLTSIELIQTDTGVETHVSSQTKSFLLFGIFLHQEEMARDLHKKRLAPLLAFYRAKQVQKNQKLVDETSYNRHRIKLVTKHLEFTIALLCNSDFEVVEDCCSLQFSPTLQTSAIRVSNFALC